PDLLRCHGRTGNGAITDMTRTDLLLLVCGAILGSTSTAFAECERMYTYSYSGRPRRRQLRIVRTPARSALGHHPLCLRCAHNGNRILRSGFGLLLFPSVLRRAEAFRWLSTKMDAERQNLRGGPR